MKSTKTIWFQILLTVVSVFALTASTCGGDPCAPAGTIVPGVGVGMKAEGDALCLGQSRSDVETLLGAGTAEHDLGGAGLRVAHPTHDLEVHYSATGGTLDAVYLDKGATYKTAGGVGLGSDSAAVKAALGAAGEDPYLKNLWYPAKGIVLQLEGGKVAAIQVMSPQQSK